jgi:phenylpropionate dioxygenase-like ring-hydroxylating dioxygenase large terminal subunit
MDTLTKGPPDLRRIDSHPNYWYPVAWYDELRARAPITRPFAGEPIVLYRNTAGRVFALEDRCAHRQVPLSQGVVAGDSIRCGYHGWTYDGCSGACIDVPYMPGERPPQGVRAYPVREIEGMVLVFAGDPRLADKVAAPPGLAGIRNPAYKTRRLDRRIDCHYTFCHENLFDMNHQFLHRRHMGMIKARELGRRSGPDWCEVEYAFQRPEGRAGIGERSILGLFSRRRRNDGEPGKGRALMNVRTEYPYQRLRVFVGGSDPALDVWLCYTPLDKAQRTNRTFGYLSVKRPAFRPLLDVMWPFVTWFTEAIFREDKHIMELEQAAYDAQGADWNREIFPAIKELRQVLARCGMCPNR